MDYQKALIILNLKPNFTEAEFKAAYRKLSMMYHPDKWEGTSFHDEAVRKQQEINEAREFLRNYLKEHQVPTGNNEKTFDLNPYKKKKINQLKKFVNKDDNIANQAFRNMSERIKDIIYIFETDVWMSFVTTKQQVDNMYNICITSIQNTIINFVESFCKENYIDEKEIKEKIDFGSNLEDFYNQLLKIKEKYSKEGRVKKRLDDEIEQYKGYAGYEHLKILVDVCKSNALYYIKQNNFQNIDEEIEKCINKSNKKYLKHIIL